MYTLTLSDGTKLENLGRNGNYFTTTQAISAETFDGKLRRVKITGTPEHIDAEHPELTPDITGEFENMQVTHIFKFEGKNLFLLLPYPEEELKQKKLESMIEYLAMMSDIELPE